MALLPNPLRFQELLERLVVPQRLQFRVPVQPDTEWVPFSALGVWVPDSLAPLAGLPPPPIPPLATPWPASR